MKDIKRKTIKGRIFSTVIIRALALLLVSVLCVGCNQMTIKDVVEETTDAITQAQQLCQINGVNIEEYTLIYCDSAGGYERRAANYIRDQVYAITGHHLNMFPDYHPARSEHEIVVGETNRDISSQLDPKTVNMQFAIMANENSIALEGDYFIIAAAAYFFVETYVTDTYFTATIPQETLIHEPIQKKAKNYILMIGDGMGFNQTLLFEKYSKDMTNLTPYSDGEDTFYGYYFPNQGQSQTKSASSDVTDSAAGATALATGYKTVNGYVGKNSSGKDVTSLTELAASLGKATAVVSTDSNTGATPASFSSHAMSRDNLDNINASQEAGVEKYDTIISCGKSPYDKSGVRKLCEELKTTLNTLSNDEDGFFMMYEEAHIDKRCHDNDMNGTFKSVVRFNQAIGTVMEYAFYNPETFVLITADHETGGLIYGTVSDFQYTQTSHSGANVPVFAYGKNAEVFNNITIENTQIPKTIAAMMGVTNFGANDNYTSLLQ